MKKKAKPLLALPDRVKIGGHLVRVHGDTTLNNYGQYHHAQRLIQISTKAAHPTQQNTLLHEILHACFKESGLHKDAELSFREERIITAFTHLLFQVIRDNPEVLAYLSEITLPEMA